MNKIKRTLSFIVLLYALLLSSCSNFLGNEKQSKEPGTVVSNVGQGAASFNIIVPEYFNCESTTDSRAISPQTAKILFRYKEDGSWTKHSVVDLADIESEPITTEIGLSGKLYNLNFKGIPAGTYKAGDMEVQLLDSKDVPLSKGTNETETIIKVPEEGKEEKTVVNFYAIPVDTANQNGSLKKGEMKFWKVTARAYCNYTLRVLALREPEEPEEGYRYNPKYYSETYPEIVLFNEKGTYHSSYSVKKDDELITIEKTNTDRIFYIGVYAREADVYCYSLSFAADNGKRSIWEQGFDYEDFEQEWNIVSNDGQIPVLTKEKSEVLDTDNVISYTFSGFGYGAQIVSRYLILDEETTLNYTVNGAICTNFDGYFIFQYHQYDYVGSYPDNSKWSTLEGDYSIHLFPGKYTITWIVYGFGPGSGNSNNIIYLYNLACTNNRESTSIKFTDDFPLETCVYNSIQLNASAYDRHNRENPSEEIKWEVVEGSGTVSDTGLFIPGEIAETCVIKATATSCNKSATVSVKVNPASDKSQPFTIGNKTYTGLVSSTGVKITTADGFTLNPIEGVPTCTTNEADGFFTLCGTLDADNSISVIVSTTVNDRYRSIEYTFTEGSFNERIWLRYGAGDYKVTIYHSAPSSESRAVTYNKSYLSFDVKNTAEVSCDEARMLFPSSICPSDNYIIQNAVKESIKDLSSDASDTEKLRAIHDWIAERTTYDYDSMRNVERRKSQDALDVIKNRLAVCEGYANLFIAMSRAIGVQTKYIISEPMNHGWAQVLIDGEWKLVDVTWDVNPGNYTYFLIGLDGVNGDHYDWEDFHNTIYYNQRSVATTEYIDR